MVVNRAGQLPGGITTAESPSLPAAHPPPQTRSTPVAHPRKRGVDLRHSPIASQSMRLAPSPANGGRETRVLEPKPQDLPEGARAARKDAELRNPLLTRRCCQRGRRRYAGRRWLQDSSCRFLAPLRARLGRPALFPYRRADGLGPKLEPKPQLSLTLPGGARIA